MDEIYNILIPYFDSGNYGGRLYDDTDRGRIVVKGEENIGLNDWSGKYFYIRYNGQEDYSDIDENCDLTLREVTVPIRVVARFDNNVDVEKAKEMMITLIGGCGTEITSSSTDFVQIMEDEMNAKPKDIEYLVRVDANMIIQKAYSTKCTEFDICNDESC